MKTKLLITGSILVILYTGYRVWNSELLAGMDDQGVGKRVKNVVTGHEFRIQLDRSFKGWPIKCPDTGKMDCYAAEACYWNECGKKPGGTWVVLNETRGIDEPTKCPVCGHPVVGHNPLPPGTYVDLAGVLHRDENYAQSAPQGE